MLVSGSSGGSGSATLRPPTVVLVTRRMLEWATSRASDAAGSTLTLSAPLMPRSWKRASSYSSTAASIAIVRPVGVVTRTPGAAQGPASLAAGAVGSAAGPTTKVQVVSRTLPSWSAASTPTMCGPQASGPPIVAS